MERPEIRLSKNKVFRADAGTLYFYYEEIREKTCKGLEELKSLILRLPPRRCEEADPLPR